MKISSPAASRADFISNLLVLKKIVFIRSLFVAHIFHGGKDNPGVYLIGFKAFPIVF